MSCPQRAQLFCRKQEKLRVKAGNAVEHGTRLQPGRQQGCTLAAPHPYQEPAGPSEQLTAAPQNHDKHNTMPASAITAAAPLPVNSTAEPQVEQSPMAAEQGVPSSDRANAQGATAGAAGSSHEQQTHGVGSEFTARKAIAEEPCVNAPASGPGANSSVQAGPLEQQSGQHAMHGLAGAPLPAGGAPLSQPQPSEDVVALEAMEVPTEQARHEQGTTGDAPEHHAAVVAQAAQPDVQQQVVQDSTQHNTDVQDPASIQHIEGNRSAIAARDTADEGLIEPSMPSAVANTACAEAQPPADDPAHDPEVPVAQDALPALQSDSTAPTAGDVPDAPAETHSQSQQSPALANDVAQAPASTSGTDAAPQAFRAATAPAHGPLSQEVDPGAAATAAAGLALEREPTPPTDYSDDERPPGVDEAAGHAQQKITAPLVAPQRAEGGSAVDAAANIAAVAPDVAREAVTSGDGTEHAAPAEQTIAAAGAGAVAAAASAPTPPDVGETPASAVRDDVLAGWAKRAPRTRRRRKNQTVTAASDTVAKHTSKPQDKGAEADSAEVADAAAPVRKSRRVARKPRLPRADSFESFAADSPGEEEDEVLSGAAKASARTSAAEQKRKRGGARDAKLQPATAPQSAFQPLAAHTQSAFSSGAGLMQQQTAGEQPDVSAASLLQGGNAAMPPAMHDTWTLSQGPLQQHLLAAQSTAAHNALLGGGGPGVGSSALSAFSMLGHDQHGSAMASPPPRLSSGLDGQAGLPDQSSNQPDITAILQQLSRQQSQQTQQPLQHPLQPHNFMQAAQQNAFAPWQQSQLQDANAWGTLQQQQQQQTLRTHSLQPTDAQAHLLARMLQPQQHQQAHTAGPAQLSAQDEQQQVLARLQASQQWPTVPSGVHGTQPTMIPSDAGAHAALSGLQAQTNAAGQDASAMWQRLPAQQASGGADTQAILRAFQAASHPAQHQQGQQQQQQQQQSGGDWSNNMYNVGGWS